MIDVSALQTSAALSWQDRRLFRRGTQHQILSGALHYFRVHPELWRDRIRRLADLGLNTVVAMQVENEFGSYGDDRGVHRVSYIR